MIKMERIRFIEEALRKKTRISIPELIALTNASRATIYRDLRDMESQGLVHMVSGGVQQPDLTRMMRDDGTLQIKKQMNLEQKRRIAAEACKLVRPGMTLFLDSSTTVYCMCEQLMTIGGLQIITNDLYIAQNMRNCNGISVLVTGGLLRRGYHTLMEGDIGGQLQHPAADITFFSCDAISLERGCMITNSGELSIKQRMLTMGRKKVLLCDYTKFLRSAFFTFSTIEEIDQIISDSDMPQEVAAQWQAAGVAITLV